MPPIESPNEEALEQGHNAVTKAKLERMEEAGVVDPGWARGSVAVANPVDPETGLPLLPEPEEPEEPVET